MMQQELESVDFYITQGYSDIALDTLELLERQFGSHPEIDSRRTKLQSGTQAGSATHESVDVIVGAPEYQTEEAVDPTAQIVFDDRENSKRYLMVPYLSLQSRRRLRVLE